MTFYRPVKVFKHFLFMMSKMPKQSPNKFKAWKKCIPHIIPSFKRPGNRMVWGSIPARFKSNLTDLLRDDFCLAQVVAPTWQCPKGALKLKTRRVDLHRPANT